MCKSAPDVQKRGHRFPAGRCPDMQPSSRRPRPDSTRGAQPFRVTTDPRPWGRQSETTAMTRASPRPGSPTGQPSRSRLPSVSRDAPSPPTLTSSRMASVRASHIDPDATWSSPQRGPRATGGLLPVFYASDDRPSRCWTSRSRHGIWPAPIIAGDAPRRSYRTALHTSGDRQLPHDEQRERIATRDRAHFWPSRSPCPGWRTVVGAKISHS